jgi:hypothetical protein
MAIVKYNISDIEHYGDISQICSLLAMWASETKAPGKLFKDVSLIGNTIYCTDWNDNIVFQITQYGNYTPDDEMEPSGHIWWYGRPDERYAIMTANIIYVQLKSPTGLSQMDVPIAIYFVGNTSICIELSSGSDREYMIVISEASDGSTAVLLPNLKATAKSQIYSPPRNYIVTSPNVDPPKVPMSDVSNSINIATVGHNVLINAQSIGRYNEKIFMPNVFVYSSINEADGLSGHMYRIETESGKSYLTNGVFAVLDKEE